MRKFNKSDIKNICSFFNRGTDVVNVEEGGLCFRAMDKDNFVGFVDNLKNLGISDMILLNSEEWSTNGVEFDKILYISNRIKFPIKSNSLIKKLPNEVCTISNDFFI
jgi:hypothetical protein